MVDQNKFVLDVLDQEMGLAVNIIEILNTYWTRPSPTPSLLHPGNIGRSEADPDIILYGCNELDVGRGQVL